jgi:UDP-2,3-diacylglucosamine pyrophosphatase LpxH
MASFRVTSQHTVVISDIHLSEAEPGTGLWMRYRQREFSPDREIADMLGALSSEVRREALTLVLNGDVFDLDAPRVVGEESVFHDLPRDAEHAVPAVRAILDDHPLFVEALAGVLRDGHRVIFIAGNHDVQLTLTEVRDAITARLVDAALERGARVSRERLAAQIGFRSWFHHTDDGIVIEHGSQYDPYCCYRYPMAPFSKDSRQIQPTMGSLATRLLASRLGYFNPHVDSSCMLSAVGYVGHWARYYLFSRRSLAFVWISGAVRTVLELVRCRDRGTRARHRANILACARETGASPRLIAAHARLFARPAEDRLGQVARSLRLDLLALVTAAALFCALWLMLAPRNYVAAAALLPALVVVYQLLSPKFSIERTWRRVRRAARKVAEIHGARAVVFGHTHHPEGRWQGGVFFGNTGSWSAAFCDIACTEPLYRERPLVWLTSDGSRELRGGLCSWQEGRFVWPASETPRHHRRDDDAAVLQVLTTPRGGNA